MNAITAIPTQYAGVNFRSRLEARWAAMFDLLGWTWEYEPLDLDGYIPDFVLQFESGPLLVEIKPALKLEEFDQAQRKVQECASAWLVGSIQDRVDSKVENLQVAYERIDGREAGTELEYNVVERAMAKDILTNTSKHIKTWRSLTPENACASWEGWTNLRRYHVVVLGAAWTHEYGWGTMADVGYSGYDWADCQIVQCHHGWTLTSSNGCWSCARESLPDKSDDTRGPKCGQPGRCGGSRNLSALQLWREAGNTVQWKSVADRVVRR